MKTSIKTLSTICAVVISLSAIAQPRNHGNGNGNGKGNQNNDTKRIYATTGYNSWNPWGGGVTVQVGNYPYYGGNPYYFGNGYGHGNYSIKKAARNSIRQSAQAIGQAMQFSDWNDMYSPWLAKAIRHQQYAKQLYFWGDYAGALNHAERAGYLAWNTLSYFNNAYGDGDGFDGYNYPNPYSDPNNPYYRQSNPNGSGNNVDPGTNMNSGNDDGDFGYRKSSGDTNTNTENSQKTERKMQKEEIDNTLPQNKMSDKELLKTNAKDLDID